MPRIVPSQVVSFIEQRIPWAAGNGPEMLVDSREVVALHHLLNAIPEELLRLGDLEYAEWLIAQVALRTALDDAEKALKGGTPNLGLGPQQKDALRTIYRLLNSCPDDYPSPSATDPDFITDTVFREDLHRDIGEVQRAVQNAEWKAATVLAGSIIEALLLWACQNQVSQDKLKAAEAKLNIGEPMERWDLADLVRASHELELITDNTRIAANLARKYRNMIHPGRVLRLAAKCDRSTAWLAVGATEAVIVDLTATAQKLAGPRS